MALDLEREGALAWWVGGDSGENEPALAGAFFLGPPLPLTGGLYALAEVQGRMKLVVLDARTGRQRWSLTMADAADRALTSDAARRLVGATPTFSQGVLVCPTSLGAVAGVDVTTRTLAWGFQPKLTPTSPFPSLTQCDGTAVMLGTEFLFRHREVACSVWTWRMAPCVGNAISRT